MSGGIAGELSGREVDDAGEAGVGPAESSFTRFLVDRQRMILGTLGIVLTLVAWQVSSDLKWVDPVFASKPTSILSAGHDYFSSGEGWTALKISGQEFGLGFLIALVAGLVLGLIIGWWRWLEYLFDPLINFAYAAPRIALVPLFIAWFGIGLKPKIVIIFLSAVFPILLNTMTGVKTTDTGLIRLARSFEASNWQIFRTVVLPGALPQIVTGVRLGVGLGLVGMVAAEFLAASSGGLGFTIITAGGNFQIATMYVAVFIVAIAGMILTSLLRILERRVDRWRPEARG